MSFAPPAASSRRRNRATAQAFVIALAWLGCLAWMRPLSIPDEGRYVGVAWEMLRSGNWITPTLDGLPFLHKPPLFYWLTATLMAFFGPLELAARGASILAGAVTVAVLYSTVREWLGDRTARLAALVLATQPLFFAASQFANLDMLVASCISACILLGANAAMRREANLPYGNQLALAYVAMALGILAKGLIGMVIPAMVLLAWLGPFGQWRSIRVLLWPPGLAIIAVIVLPWFLTQQSLYPRFFDYFFWDQHFRRFVGTGFNGAQPHWFYGPVLLGFTLPWSAWLIPLLRQSRWPRSTGAAVLSLMWVWLGTVILFFSIPQSKLVGYVIPALTPLAVLVAIAASRLCGVSGLALRMWRISFCFAGTLCIGGAIAFALVHPKSSKELAIRLAAQRAAGEGIAFVDDYRYDVPFYLGESVPIVVVSSWDPADVQSHDNWRKELADAGSFAPSLAAGRLVDQARFVSMVCDRRITWVIASVDQSRNYAFLEARRAIAFAGERALWHTDVTDPRFGSTVGCNRLPRRDLRE